MDKLTNNQWQGVFKLFCHDCYMFWRRQGCSVATSFEKARKETLNLKSYPYSPKGELVNKKELAKWRKLYSQELVGILHEYEESDSICDLRICTYCGFPVFDGYYLYADFFCCDRCAIEGCYGGDKERFEQDLKEAENESSPIWSDVYYSQWEEPIYE